MTPPIQLREATPDDLPVLERFEQGVIAAERPFDETLGADPIRYYDLADFIHSDDVYMVIAEQEKTPVASGYIRILNAKAKYRHDRYGYIGFMYVAPEQRGKGLNQRVIAELLKWARQRGIREVQLDVYEGNVAAIRAYEKAGFGKNLMNMRIDLAAQ